MHWSKNLKGGKASIMFDSNLNHSDFNSSGTAMPLTERFTILQKITFQQVGEELWEEDLLLTFSNKVCYLLYQTPDARKGTATFSLLTRQVCFVPEAERKINPVVAKETAVAPLSVKKMANGCFEVQWVGDIECAKPLNTLCLLASVTSLTG